MKHDFFQSHLDKLQAEGQFRTLRNIENRSGNQITVEGKEFFNLSSNDYLGIGGNLALQNAFLEEAKQSQSSTFSMTSSSSRLLTGNSSVYLQLENQLKKLYQRTGCLFFNSGYHCNIGILPAVSSKDDLIISDKLNHASIIDGIVLSKAEHIRYRHCDYDQLERLLSEKRNNYKNVFIVSESIFSMDGDSADLERLCEIKNRFDAFLYIDEAHAYGTRGTMGLGLCEEQNVISQIDFIVGTFGKAAASQGAYVICDNLFEQYLINTMRSLIFTTALPPAVLSWNLMIAQKLPEMQAERKHLAEISNQLIQKLSLSNISSISNSNIIPVPVGKNDLAVKLAQAMQDCGYLVFAIRPPTVPKNTSRLRLSITADMTWSQLEPVANELVKQLQLLNSND